MISLRESHIGIGNFTEAGPNRLAPTDSPRIVENYFDTIAVATEERYHITLPYNQSNKTAGKQRSSLQVLGQ